MTETEKTVQVSEHDRGVAGKLLMVILILLPFVLLGLGYYLVTIPEGTVLAGVRQTIWFGVGQSVIASALVSLVMLVGSWADRITANARYDLVLWSLADYRTAADVMKQTGLRCIHNDRYIRPVYQRYQAQVSHRLDLLGMSLKHFQQDVGNELVRWVRDREDLQIRIIVLNPNSPYCSTRDREEGVPPGEIAEWALRLTETVLRANSPCIQIRWHNTIPTVNMYRLDDVMFIGPYLIGRLSRLTTTLEVDVKGLLADQYLQHFESLRFPPQGRADWSQIPTLSDVAVTREKLTNDGK